jgi:hypothetical protein
LLAPPEALVPDSPSARGLSAGGGDEGTTTPDDTVDFAE